MLNYDHATKILKFLSENLFVWSMPISMMVLNIIKERDVFEINVVIAFILGLMINIVWDISCLYLNKKEYHKNLL